MGNLLNAKSLTFFDVETTHLDAAKSAILQIAIVTDWEDGRRDVWTTKIKPKDIELKFADKEALRVCNYNEHDWKDAPSFNEVAEVIAKKLRWGPIIGHNVQFDIAHLTAVFHRYGWSKCETKIMADPSVTNKLYRFGYPVIDTCSLAYLFLDSDYQNLDHLREHLNLDKTKSHDALYDTIDCSKVFYEVINRKYQVNEGSDSYE